MKEDRADRVMKRVGVRAAVKVKKTKSGMRSRTDDTVEVAERDPYNCHINGNFTLIKVIRAVNKTSLKEVKIFSVQYLKHIKPYRLLILRTLWSEIFVLQICCSSTQTIILGSGEAGVKASPWTVQYSRTHYSTERGHYKGYIVVCNNV